jgi:hypothetical protein
MPPEYRSKSTQDLLGYIGEASRSDAEFERRSAGGKLQIQVWPTKDLKCAFSGGSWSHKERIEDALIPDSHWQHLFAIGWVAASSLGAMVVAALGADAASHAEHKGDTHSSHRTQRGHPLFAQRGRHKGDTVGSKN